jgi:hypothetical protein
LCASCLYGPHLFQCLGHILIWPMRREVLKACRQLLGQACGHQ